jgi:hypothetical protein
MSQMQVDATSLLCGLLETESGEINGHALHGYPNQAGACLVKERMLSIGRSRSWSKCPECQVEQARYVRDVSSDQILLRCPDCLDVSAPTAHVQTLRVAFDRFISALLNGLELSRQGLIEIERDLIWKLGTTQKTRGKPTTWYFARRLKAPRVAERLRQQIMADKSAETCAILTSASLSLESGHVLSQLDVRSLPMVGRISTSAFHMFDDRLEMTGVQPVNETKPRTTLRYLNEGVAYVDGQRFELAKSQVRLLQALIEDRDNEMTREELRDRCGSQSQSFSPSKVFERNKVVYHAFVQHQEGDGTYMLLIDKDKEFFD